MIPAIVSKDAGLTILGGTVLLWGCYSGLSLIDSVKARQAVQPDNYPRFSDLKISAIWFAIFTFTHLVLFYVLGPTARKLIPKKPHWTSEVWGAKLERFCSAVFQLVLSAGATIYLYMTLRDSSWLPMSMGGSGSTSNCWTDGFPLQQVPDSLRKFYLVFMGYSSSELFGHILRERNRPDFYELLVHLVVTNILLIFSYFGNLMRIGSLVILANTFSDVFVYIAKALVDTKLTGGALSYIPLLVVYVWCRIYLHAAVVMKSVWKEAPALISNPAGLANWHYFYFLLSVILMMHMYWMFVIFKIGLFLLSTGKSRDLQACLSSLNVRQQIPHGVHTNPSATSSMEDVKSVTTAASEKKRAVRRR